MTHTRLLLFLTMLITAGCQLTPVATQPANTPTASQTPTLVFPERPTRTPKPPVFFLSPTPEHPNINLPTPRPIALEDTATPSVTATTSIIYPTVTLAINPRGLDVPIGDYYKFVIHKSKGGERLEDYAEKYNTSVEAIMQINFRLTNPVWAAVLFVIPVGFTEVEQLPIFVVYQVKSEERGISTDALAAKLRVNPFDLKYYNNMLKEGDRPLVGDFILVPWPRTVDKVNRE